MSFETDVAWVAGLLEGEGCFRLKQYGIGISCTMTDLDTIEKLHAIMGGHIGKTVVKPNRKDCYPWELSMREDVVRWCLLLQPYMGRRRSQKIDELLEYDRLNVKGTRRKKAEHGTIGMYTNHKCHCDLCQAAWRAYYDRRKIEKGEVRVSTQRQDSA